MEWVKGKGNEIKNSQVIKIVILKLYMGIGKHIKTIPISGIRIRFDEPICCYRLDMNPNSHICICIGTVIGMLVSV